MGQVDSDPEENRHEEKSHAGSLFDPERPFDGRRPRPTSAFSVFFTIDDLLPMRPKNAHRRLTDAEVVILCFEQGSWHHLRRPLRPDQAPRFSSRSRVTSAARSQTPPSNGYRASRLAALQPSCRSSIGQPHSSKSGVRRPRGRAALSANGGTSFAARRPV